MKKSERDAWLDDCIIQSVIGRDEIIRTIAKARSGKYSVDCTNDYAQYLIHHGCTVVAGNDSPRGGKLGDYIRITTRHHPKTKSERYIKPIRLNYAKGDKRSTAAQKRLGEKGGWDVFECERGYGIFNDGCNGNDGIDYIARIDEMGVFDGDASAAKQAKKDGLKFMALSKSQKEYVRGLDVAPCAVLDTKRNRKTLETR